jgi:hypothetical protein
MPMLPSRAMLQGGILKVMPYKVTVQ